MGSDIKQGLLYSIFLHICFLLLVIFTSSYICKREVILPKDGVAIQIAIADINKQKVQIPKEEIVNTDVPEKLENIDQEDKKAVEQPALKTKAVPERKEEQKRLARAKVKTKPKRQYKANHDPNATRKIKAKVKSVPRPIKKPLLPSAKALNVPKGDELANRNNIVQPLGVDNRTLEVKYANIICDCIRTHLNLIALSDMHFDSNIEAHFLLDKRGYIVGEPEINVDAQDRRQKFIATKQAGAALRSCTPFGLPLKDYKIWREVDVVFSLNEANK